MKWFRFYSEVLHDSKVQTLSPELFRSWINMLCLANEASERGRLPELKQIAFALRLREERATQVIGQLTACGLIDELPDGGYQPHNWSKRQRQSDDVSNRVRVFRERKSTVSSNGNVTLHETEVKHDGNVTVTPRARSDSETDSETDSEQKPPFPPEGGVVVARETALTIEAENAIEDIRAKHGEPAADLARREAKLIDRQLGGRWDLFVDAIEAASRRRPKLEDRNVLSWCMTRAVANLHKPPGVDNGVATSGAADALPTETLEQRKARLSKATEAMKAHLARGGR